MRTALLRRRRLDGHRGPLLGGGYGGAVAEWRMARQADGDAAYFDWSGNGHHRWWGGVHRAILADTWYADRGLICPGIAGNYGRVPDGAALRVTGDIEIYALVRIVAPTGSAMIVARWTSAGNQRSYDLSVNAGGFLRLQVSPDGTAASSVNIISTATLAAVGIDANELSWLKATLDVNDGAGHYVAKFWYSAGGDTWTQLGASVVGAATTSIFAGTANLNLGANDEGTAVGSAMTVYRAVIKNGIGGPTVFDTGDLGAFPQGTRTLTCASGQVLTVMTNGTSAAEPIRLFAGVLPRLWQPGTAGNSLTVPFFAAQALTGKIEARAVVAPNDWTPAAASRFVDCINGALSGYYFSIEIGGLLRFANATGAAVVTTNATLPVPAADGTWCCVRCVFDPNNGANRVASFYTKATTLATAHADMLSDAGWTLLETVTAASTTIVAATLGYTLLTSLLGSAAGVSVENATTDTVIFDLDLTNAGKYNAVRPGDATALTALTGQVATINRSTSGYKSAVVAENLVLYDGVDDHASADDRVPLRLAAGENLTLALANRAWATQGAGYFFGKYSGADSYRMQRAVSWVNCYLATLSGAQSDSTSGSTTAGQRYIHTLRKLGAVIEALQDGATNGGATAWDEAVANTAVLTFGALSPTTGFTHFEELAAAAWKRALTLAQIAALTLEM